MGVEGVLFVEPLSVLEVVVGVVSSERVGDDFVIGVAEVDVAHVLLVKEHIGVESVVVPGVMKIVIAEPVLMDHENQSLGHAVKDVGPENGSQHVEPSISRAHKFVIGVS